jgi:hypothetical protein
MMLAEILSNLDESKPLISLDAESEHLVNLRDLVDGQNFKAVAELNESLVEQGILDIRFLTYSVYSELSEDKLSGFSLLFENILKIFSVWENVGPEKRRDKYAKSSLVWLFKQIILDLKTLEFEKNDKLDFWFSLVSFDELSDIRTKIASTRSVFSNQLDANTSDAVLAPITELLDWLKKYESKLPKVEVISESIQEETVIEESTDKAITAHGNGSGNLVISGGVHLEELQRKVDVFASVLAKGEILKAAIIVNDINGLLESFDARKYLPWIFGPYFTELSQHVNQVADYSDSSGTPQWLALTDLYTADLDLFLKVKID